MTFDLSHARHDKAHCLAPGLFRSLAKGERKKLKLDVTYQHGESTTLRFIGFEPLDAKDMRLLQGIVALSGPRGIVLTDEPKTERGRQLRLLLDPTLDAMRSDALVVKSKLSELMSEIGYLSDNDKTRNDMKESLLRMSNVTLNVKTGSREASFHLLSYQFDTDDKSLFVALNPRVTAAIMGSAGGFTRIEMSEVRALQSDPARLIHQRLCGWIDINKSERVTLDTLCSYVNPEVALPEAMKKRRTKARRALAELVAMGWRVSEYAPGKFEIHRPVSARPLDS